MNCPLVSVVIPFFNRIEMTERAVESVLSQTYKNIEIILVDDYSSVDDSALLKFISSHNNIIHIKLEKNVGPGEARNIGIKNASGEYIAFLDSDDAWENEKLEIQIGKMQENQWEFSHTSYYRYNYVLDETVVVNSALSVNIYPFIAFHCRIATPCVVVTKKVLDETPFNASLRVSEDTLLWLELSRKIALHGINIPLARINIGHQPHFGDPAGKEHGLYVIGREAFSHNRPLYLLHSLYRMIRIFLRRYVWDKFKI